jgi:hypothetical protein
MPHSVPPRAAGYYTGDPNKRTPGSALANLSLVGMIFYAAYIGLRMARGA